MPRRLRARHLSSTPEPKVAVHGVDTDTARSILEDWEIKPIPQVNFSLSGAWVEPIMFIFDFEDIKKLTYPHFYLAYTQMDAEFRKSKPPKYAVDFWTWITTGAEITTQENIISLDKVDQVFLTKKGLECKSMLEEKGLPTTRETLDSPLGKWMIKTTDKIRKEFENPMNVPSPEKPPSKGLGHRIMAYNEMVANEYGLGIDKVLKEVTDKSEVKPWWQKEG